ncbi:hypothetical protein XA68_11338 [Ophiocordyceps unilateralis]|uniref:AMP-dependent synthetase/ligase domain-containing protein n=1 Tax=Ophiocordyceps unilateralis TaxID=268505 RepID=A0A2A9PH13_OPHUN|nr:hypothetical protein XA68_11338 [Ophiocordyceps unilateralis]
MAMALSAGQLALAPFATTPDDHLSLPESAQKRCMKMNKAREETEEATYRQVAEAGLGLAQLFYKQAQKNAEAMAVVDGSTSLSYGQLHARAARLAHLLNLGGDAAGLGQEPVGIVVQHGVADVVAQMAVLYAGGSCAPMDPTLVDHQIEARLTRLDARFVVVDEENMGRALPFEILCIDRDADSAAGTDSGYYA